MNEINYEKAFALDRWRDEACCMRKCLSAIPVEFSCHYYGDDCRYINECYTPEELARFVDTTPPMKMTKYKVTVKEIWVHTFEVAAMSEKDARDVVETLLGSEFSRSEYSHTLDSSEWDVEED